MDKIAAGEELDDSSQEKEKVAGVEETPIVPEDLGVEPPQPQFVMDMPNVSHIDLCVPPHVCEDPTNEFDYRDIMKLTALFTARRGRTFLATLSQNEGMNYQFDFLRPTHSLFGYFNRLVEQYQKVLYPGKETLSDLSSRTQEGAKWTALEQSRKYARWERLKREKDKKRQDDQEAEKRTWFFPHLDNHYDLFSFRCIC
jgi:splicing factor 3A subunit 1